MKKLSKVKRGFNFEREAYEFLKKKFDRVIWLSKKEWTSKYDFLCITHDKEYYVDATLLNGKNLDRKKGADFLVVKKDGKIKILNVKEEKREIIRRKRERVKGEEKIIKLLKNNIGGLNLTQLVNESKLTRDQVRITLAKLEGRELTETTQIGMAKLIILKPKVEQKEGGKTPSEPIK